MSLQSEEGISRLLQAEKEAQKVVTAARNERKERLKQAKKEAKADVDDFMNERTDQFKKFRDANAQGTSEQQAQLQIETTKKIDAINAAISKETDVTVEMLLGLVTKV